MVLRKFYKDIESGNFNFVILLTRNNTQTATTKNNAQGKHYLILQDFGELKPGAQKEFEFTTSDPYMTEIGLGFQNGFNSMQSEGNGEKAFLFEFTKTSGASSYTMLSNRPEYKINMQLGIPKQFH